MKINIIGLGTAGLASALFFAQQGHQVRVFESAKELSPVGAGLLLQPTGLEILKKLDLYEKALILGSRIESLFGSTTDNRTVLDLKYKDLHPSYFGLGIHRASLFDLLYSKFQELNIELVTGTAITNYQQHQNQVKLFSNNLLDSCDLLIVANGARSNLRKLSPHFISDKQYPWGAIWSIEPITKTINKSCLEQKYQSAHTMLGLLPTGKLTNSTQEMVSLFWSLPVQNFKSLDTFDLKTWKNNCAQQWPKTKEVLKQIHSKQQIAFATYQDVKMKKFVHGNVVYIGDAAHGMSPQLGQGANMALIDAYFLSQLVTSQNSIKEDLEQYSLTRKKHTNYYQFMSRWLTPFYQSHSKLLGSIKDYCSYPASKIPFIKTQMLKTLTGISRFKGL